MRLLKAVLAEPDSGQPSQPKAPRFATHLQLTPEREKWLVKRVLTRVAEVSRDMGLEEDGAIVSDSWMGLRSRYQQTYENDFEWRKKSLGGVFSTSNLTLGIANRYVHETASKLNDDFFGTSPFMQAIKRDGSSNPEATQLADGIEQLIQTRIELSNVAATLRMAQKVGLIRNEAVVKTRFVLRSTPYVGPATVYVDAAGNPITTSNGFLIYDADQFLPDPNAEGTFRLAKDPTFSMTQGQYRIKAFDELPQSSDTYHGVETSILDFRSFICPLDADSIHEADFNAQLFDETVERLAETYRGFEVFDRYSDGLQTSGEKQPRTSQGEKPDGSRSTIVNTRRMIEAYIRCDADGDGFEEEIFIVIDRTSEAALFYEYLANQMPRRPFEVIVGVERMPNRWYGVGVNHIIFDTTNYIDAQFNRYNIKDSRESSFTFRDPQATKEWKAGLPAEGGNSIIYDLEPGFDETTRPPIFRKNLNEVSEIGYKLMELMIQMCDLRWGILSNKDASASRLNTSRTATGVLNMERTANTLVKATEAEQQIGVEAVLLQAVELIIENMKDREMFFSKDGAILHSLSREEAREIDKDVKLLLTRMRTAEMLAVAQQALGIAKDYHAMRAQSPQTAKDLRPLYLCQLKDLETPDADDLLPQISDQEIAQFAQNQQDAAAKERDARLSERVNLNYKDAPDAIRAQIEAADGFTPASDAQRSGQLEAEAAAKAKAAPAKPNGKAPGNVGPAS